MIAISENIVQYIRDYTSLSVADSILLPTSPDDVILVRETGGTSRRWPDDRQDATIQFLARSKSDPGARDISVTVWDLFRNIEFSTTILAADKTGSVDVLIKKIDIHQRPYPMGLTDGYYWYSFNASVIFADP
jgi:hypothetical protein